NRGSCISSIPRIASAAKDHEHDIHNARPSNPVYTGPKFNSLLGIHRVTDASTKRPRRYSTHYRAAALRLLVVAAPESVTGGLAFAERRRRVRNHYGI
ncbi:hypothetical protein FSB64_41030, partial [Paraburkholderia sp. JPY454]|nr:hypothetical protein [Paraburkholderia youngii]